jgi:hypothetical protein
VSSPYPEDEHYDDLFWASVEAEQDWANRWLEAWERLEPLGVVSNPEDCNMPLTELERLVEMLGDDDATG